MEGEVKEASSFSRKFGQFLGEHLVKPAVEFRKRKIEGFNVRISGTENLETLKNCSWILVANHLKPNDFISIQTGFAPDAFILERLIKQTTGQRLRIAAKVDSGFLWGKNRIIHKFQKSTQPLMQGIGESLRLLPILKNPGSLNRDFLRAVGKAIANQEPLLLFPEGDWYEDFDPKNPLDTGAAHIAKKYQLAIVPVYIDGATSWKPGTKVEVIIGQPFETIGLSKQEITENIRQEIFQLQQKAKSIQSRSFQPKP